MAAGFLKALADRDRLLILCILLQGERSVSELERMLALRQPTVSQRLARLRRDGKTVHYSLANETARTVVGAICAAFHPGD